ncbi:methionine synthase reductase [Sitophilus oryzae]|uniref:Methionine synthase reductase n=1 Tax=Sitophilus oryzae TaxID=7048 RepID=A0A6J2YMS3_SITOR|nr:methionine synthase reductase [Sitophilus oryzae]
MDSNYLKITFTEQEQRDLNNNCINSFQYRSKPFINSDLYLTTIEDIKRLTTDTEVKTVYQYDLSRKDIEYQFKPGDTIGILPPNNEEEVNRLLLRLNYESQSHKIYKLTILEQTTKKNPSIPKHVPENSTLYSIFLNNIDIRLPPKKVFLKSLIKYTTDTKELELLEKICSSSSDYMEFLYSHKTLLSLFNAFPSCFPPVEIILQHSSPLHPRYFSIASSPLETDILSIIFHVVEYDNGTKGVCTGWLDKLYKNQDIKNTKIPFYFRKSGDFNYTISTEPTVLIATGTGIVPFRSFLRHKELIERNEEQSKSGDVLLYYGCRYQDRDFLLKEEIYNFIKNGTLTKLFTSFSRESTKKCYVQHELLKNGSEIVNLLLNKKANLFICGNAKTTVKSVRETIIECFVLYGLMDKSSAEEQLTILVKNKKFLVDNYWI